jgi:hypothetical protein
LQFVALLKVVLINIRFKMKMFSHESDISI